MHKTYYFGCGCEGDKFLHVESPAIPRPTRYCPKHYNHELEIWALPNKRCVLLRVKTECLICGETMILTGPAKVSTKRPICADCKEREAAAKKLKKLYEAGAK